MSRALLALLLALVAAAAPVRAAAVAAPSHVVSINLCADQYLVRLAPGQVVALSPLARDAALSAVSVQAGHLPWVRADAEAVLRLHPDLVLAGRFAARETASALAGQGVPVVFLDDPQDFAAIRAETRRMGTLLAARAAAETWIGEMDRALAGYAPTGKRAMLWQARGWTSGPGSLGDAVLRAAGYDDVGTGGPVGLERLLAAPPDLLVVEQAPHFPSLATDLVRHPSLAKIPRIALPAALLICGTPDTAQAVSLLTR